MAETDRGTLSGGRVKPQDEIVSYAGSQRVHRGNVSRHLIVSSLPTAGMRWQGAVLTIPGATSVEDVDYCCLKGSDDTFRWVPWPILTTKGDLLSHDGLRDMGRLPVGSDKDILTADSGESLGLNWKDPATIDLDDFNGPLAIGKGGTGQTAQAAAFDALAPGTTKGDVLVHGASDHERLGIGSNDEVLTADSGESTGVKWAPSPTRSTVLGFSGAQASLTGPSTRYLGFGCANVVNSELYAQLYCPVAGTVKNLYVWVQTNSTSATCTVTIRLNGVSTALTVSFGSGVTGLQTDLSNSFSVAIGDKLGIQAVAGGFSGIFKIQAVSMEIELA